MNGPERRRGRKPLCSYELALRIVRLQRQGLSYQAIGVVLTAEGIPTAVGRPRWRKSHVNRLLHTMYVGDIQTKPEQHEPCVTRDASSHGLRRSGRQAPAIVG
jgi:Recombinase